MGPLPALDRKHPNVLSFATCFNLSRIIIKHRLNENTQWQKSESKKFYWHLSFSLPSLSSATPSSASLHHLLFTLFCLESIGSHHPHNWCLVELGLDGGGFAENGDDGGEDKPIRLMEENVSISGLSKDMTLRRLVDVELLMERELLP